MTMGDRVAVLKDGLLQQVDTPLDLYDNPKDKFVAGFMGSPAMNLLEADLADGGARIGDYLVPIPREILAKAGDDKTITVGIRPEAFKVVQDGKAGLPVKVVLVEELGADAFLHGTAEHIGQQIVARIDARMHCEKGSILHLAAQPEQLHLFSTSTEERLTA
jgi:multiple sugar transport system ATP-binding protein